MAEPPNPWAPLVDRCRAAAEALPPLPAFAELAHAEPSRLFAELGYTFWNRELLDRLAARCRAEGCRRWLEVAAGTGRWAAELARRGVDVAATDNLAQAPERVRGSQRPIRYGGWVAPLDARRALAELLPEGLLTAWPPLGSCLVPDLLMGTLPGSERLRLIVCIGEPGGATEAPASPEELPPGWTLERWPECEPFLFGFNDPPPGPGWRSHSRLLVYRASSTQRDTEGTR